MESTESLIRRLKPKKSDLKFIKSVSKYNSKISSDNPNRRLKYLLALEKMYRNKDKQKTQVNVKFKKSDRMSFDPEILDREFTSIAKNF